MENLVQQATRLNWEKHQQEQGKQGAFAGNVVGVTPLTDEFALSFGAASSRSMPVQHPFSGQNSWLRSMPEVGAQFLMQNRFDTGQPEALKAIPAFSQNKANNYQSGLNIYRTMQPGEHDIASYGYATAFFSRRGNLDLRSGAAVKVQLDLENQESRMQAPTLKRNLLYNTLGQMGDEERLGIVKRWSSAAKEFYVKTTDGNNYFTTERYLQLTNPGGPTTATPVLLRHIEGQVYDDSGNAILHPTTALPLRSQSLWYTALNNTLTKAIDQNGNLIYNFPVDATTGWEIQIPQGGYRAVIGANRDVTTYGNDNLIIAGSGNTYVGGNVTYTVFGDYSLEVSGDYDGAIGGDQSHTITGDQDLKLLGSQSSDILGSVSYIIAGSVSYTMVGGETYKIGGDQSYKIAGDVSYDVVGDVSYDVLGDVSVTAPAGDVTLTASGLAELKLSTAQVALGIPGIELLSLLYMTFTALGTCQVISPLGLCTPIAGSAEWAAVQVLLTELQLITGSL